MAVIFRHPSLPDYFKTSPPGRSVVDAYEAGQVIVLDWRPAIDHAFWASLSTDDDPLFKKLALLGEDFAPPAKLGANPQVKRIAQEVRSLMTEVLPVYKAAFARYSFVTPRVCCRLNTQRNLDLHFDTYPGREYDSQLARMFINLDGQPRIWNTGFQVGEIIARWGAGASGATAGEWWHDLRRISHGEGPADWWRGPQPRHAIHFEAGDVWIVDSRQVAHQVVYGRRCLSIDFVVDTPSMRDPGRHYLALVERSRHAS